MMEAVYQDSLINALGYGAGHDTWIERGGRCSFGAQYVVPDVVVHSILNGRVQAIAVIELKIKRSIDLRQPALYARLLDVPFFSQVARNSYATVKWHENPGTTRYARSENLHGKLESLGRKIQRINENMTGSK